MSRVPTPRRPLKRTRTVMPVPWERRVRARTAVAAVRSQPAAGELKFHDVDIDQAVADLSAGVILGTDSWNKIVQDVTEKTRVGRKCTVRSIGWRANLKYALNASTALGTPHTVRLMVVLDKQANGAAPTVTGVLESANYQSFNNLANTSRFMTLFDTTIPLNYQAAAGDGTTNDAAPLDHPFTFFKKCNIVLEFDDSVATGAIGSIRSNNIFGIMISSIASSTASLDSKVRLRFSDN